MNIPDLIVGAGVAGFAGLQAWTLREVVRLGRQVAVLIAQCPLCNQKPKKEIEP